MRRIQLAGLAALLGLSLTATLPLSSCSSGGDSATSGPMYIETCTLGCSNGQTGQQVSCTIVDVAQNVEVTVLFSQAVNLASVNAGSFRITNTLNGSSPVGTFALDPLNSKRLIFRPALTFDAVGNPIFALDPNQTYEILVPGTAQGDTGPIISSTAGKVNETRLRCTINTTQGLLDPVPGPPSAVSAVVVTEKDNGEVLEVFQPADGAVGVPVGGGADGKNVQIVTQFNDIMNPATLANLATGQSSSVTVQIDVDGDPVTTTDRVTQAGSFQVQVAFEQLRTFLTFTPTGGFPSGGASDAPRYVVLNVSVAARDLVGNPLSNPGESLFQTVLIDFPELVLPEADPDIPGDEAGEQFQTKDNEDTARSGADWGAGRLTFGQGGGTGRAGAFTIRTGDVVWLDTDSQEFPHTYDPPPGAMDARTSFSQVYDVLDNAVPGDCADLQPGEYCPTDRTTWPKITVEDGAFEFTQFTIQAGGILRLLGSNPGRIFSRGEMLVDGLIDICGGSAPDQLSNTGNASTDGLDTAQGGTGGAPGPNGGAGGDGGDRFNHGKNGDPPDNCPVNPMVNAGGLVYPDPQPENNPGSDTDGTAGGGVGLSALAAGAGGPHWPPSPPRTLGTGSPSPCRGDSEWVMVMDSMGILQCRIAMTGGAGGGGGYALDGGAGISTSPEEGLPTFPGNLGLSPGPTEGGLASEVGLEAPGTVPATVRKLDYQAGNLRGGSGGGGAGMSIYGTVKNTPPMPGQNCYEAGTIFPNWDHSGGGGGGGGGAIQLVSGTRLSVGFNGSIDAHGGSGGGSISSSFPITNCVNTSEEPLGTSCTDLAQPGGGGSGGAVRLQSLVVDVAAISNKLIVEGGLGGSSSTGSLGGDGSPGLVRIEKANAGDINVEAAIYAPTIAPYLPNDPEFNIPFVSAAILSIGKWEFQRNRPDSLNASASCWMVPEGNFFELEFLADQSMEENPTDDPAGKGWNMDVLYSGTAGTETYPYRGLPQDSSSPLGNVDFQTFLGNLINSDEDPGEGSLIAVRFQGARAAGDIDDPCDVALSGFGSEIQANSLTRWVMHPDELNEFLPRPNMVRFCVVFEENLKAQNSTNFRIQGVTNLRVNVQPN